MNQPARTPLQKNAAVRQLEDLVRAGVTHLPRSVSPQSSGPLPETVAAPPPPAGQPPVHTPASPLPSALPIVTASATPALAIADRPAALEQVRRDVAACTRCAELASTRTQTVFGVGNPSARLCFLGEAPGADEDAQGEPFVGRAGQLLTRIIEACTLRRTDVYILNILKCRPPNNRNPLPQEADNCRAFLDRQLDIIRPEFICCLGAVAAKNLLGTEVSISKLRGNFFRYRGADVLCTYHPAYLLRNPPAKRQVWEDMQILMARMGIELPSQNPAS